MIFVLLCFIILRAFCEGQYVTDVDDCIRNGVNVPSGFSITQDNVTRQTCGFLMKADPYIVVQPNLVNIGVNWRIQLFALMGEDISSGKILIHEYYGQLVMSNLMFVSTGRHKFALVVLTTISSNPIGKFQFIFRTSCFVEMAAEDLPMFNSPNFYPGNLVLMDELNKYNFYGFQCFYRIYSRDKQPFTVKFNDIFVESYSFTINNIWVQQRTIYSFNGTTDVFANYSSYYNAKGIGFSSSVNILSFCGHVSFEEANIISNNGSVTTFGANPWQVRLIPLSVNEWCSATILNQNWLITAANCFTTSFNLFYISTMFSSYHWDSSNWAKTNTIQQLFIHPSYSAVTGDYNIALIKVDSPISFNSFVQPICLPSSNFSFTGIQCKTTGWIQSHNLIPSISHKPLMGKSVQILSSDYCTSQTQFESSRMAKYLCSNNNLDPSAIFNGESGGPLVCSVNGKNTLVGVVARSVNGTQPKSIRLFSRVDVYLDWIQRTINQN